MKISNTNPLLLFITAVLLVYVIGFSEESLITNEEIASAEKLIGLKFSESERDSMLDNLNDNLQSYLNIRKVHLENSIIPSLLFNPIPKKFKFPQT
jgi:hypothetical protein